MGQRPAPAAIADDASLPDDAAALHPLANGVRVLAMTRPHLHTAGVSVFVRVGSAHESRALNGIGHVLEHMAFKGTRERDAYRVNLDAERLGAEVNAHTDKDHTAYHMRGLGEHAPQFVAMLADIVRHATFPHDELAREREVLLQEVAEVEDDPITVAYQLFDHACWGTHPGAQPVIGQRRVIERCTREQLAAHVQQHYTGANVVVAAVGAIDAAAVLRAAEASFGDMPRGQANELPAADYAGGHRVKRMDVGRQMHLVMGYPVAGRGDPDVAVDLAAAVLGDGMSSPLLAELREKRGLVYHAACNADRFEFGGQLAIEASFAPDHLGTVLGQVVQLMRALAERVDAVDLERARNQAIVRLLRHDERVAQRLEDAALDLFALQRVRSVGERLARVRDVSLEQVRAAFGRMLAAGASVAITGSVGRATTRRIDEALAG
ncbi:MAG TPA: pitrilysin family protein [Burkholderiaceae bacterium]|nr:pitrilysin family protein [Burkholderiaceae bacterium]